MKNDSLITIREFNLIGQDERGVTSEFKLPRHQSEFIYISRKKGSISGNTYHTGKSDATNPKIFLLLDGQILIQYRKIGDAEKYQDEVTAPAVIEIATYVTHKIEALKDCVLLECNSIKDIQADRTKENV